MIKLDKTSLVVIGSLIATLCLQAEAKTNLRLVTRAKFAARIEFGCVTSKYPKRRLARVVRGAMKGLVVGDIGVYGNKAIAVDLNKDGKPEYFIPLDCGGTGNCNWGIFALDPPRRLGIMPAQGIYIQHSAGWPVLATYIHGSATEGLVSVYKYASTRYVKTRGDLEVSADRKDFPKSMEKTRSTCEQSNGSKERRMIERHRSSANE